MSWKNLDRDTAVETRVPSTIDLSHAARAQQSDDLIRPEFGARGEGHPRAIIVRRKYVAADRAIVDGLSAHSEVIPAATWLGRCTDVVPDHHIATVQSFFPEPVRKADLHKQAREAMGSLPTA